MLKKKNVPLVLVLKFSMFLIISQMKKKEAWILCQAAPGLGQGGVSIFVLPGLITLAIVINLP